MTTNTSLPAASSLAAPGGVSLDTPASPATITSTTPNATSAADFTAAMSKASDEAKGSPGRQKSTKTNAPGATSQKSPVADTKTETTRVTVIEKKTTTLTIASSALNSVIASAAKVLAGSPVKIASPADAIAENADDIEAETDAPKKNQRDEAQLGVTLTAAPAASEMDVSTTSILLALLSQPATFPKDLQRLAPNTPGNPGENTTCESEVLSGARAGASLTVTATPTTTTTVPGSAVALPQVSWLPDTKAATVLAATIPPVKAKTTEPSAKPAKTDGLGTTTTSNAANPLDVPARMAKTLPSGKSVETFLQPITNGEDDLTSASQAVVTQAHAVLSKEVNTPILSDGTGVALNGQKMKFASEKNEIAGCGVQNVPTAAVGDSVSPTTAVRAVASANANSSGAKKDFSQPTSTIDPSSALPTLNVIAGKTVENLVPPNQSAVQAERIGHLVSQEVFAIRQSGANTLGVSLKVDAHTEIFLQLTNHNGQMQATISCERGDAAGLGSHWNDLQQSLSKQNVQLMPLEDKSSLRPPVAAATVTPTTSGSSNFNQSSQNYARQNRHVENDPTMDTLAVKTRSTAVVQTKTSSPQGWESWA